jgi:hypothetical protein
MSRKLQFPGGTQQVMIRLPKEQYDRMMQIAEIVGVPLAEQFRRAVTGYLKTQTKVRRPRGSISLLPRHAVKG